MSHSLLLCKSLRSPQNYLPAEKLLSPHSCSPLSLLHQEPTSSIPDQLTPFSWSTHSSWKRQVVFLPEWQTRTLKQLWSCSNISTISKAAQCTLDSSHPVLIIIHMLPPALPVSPEIPQLSIVMIIFTFSTQNSICNWAHHLKDTQFRGTECICTAMWPHPLATISIHLPSFLTWWLPIPDASQVETRNV